METTDEPQIVSRLDADMCECRHHRNAHKHVEENQNESCNECVLILGRANPCSKFTVGNIYSDFREDS